MGRLDFLRDPEWRRKTLSEAFGTSFWGFLGVAVATGLMCYALEGPVAVVDALGRDAALILTLLPRVVVAVTIAALIWFMLPREAMSRLIGRDSGLTGLAIGTVAGAVTPGGPAAAYALLGMLLGAGAGAGPMVSYITAWALLGLQRTLLWDVPFMGVEFALTRLLISLPLPILAGLVAGRLPLQLKVPETVSGKAPE